MKRDLLYHDACTSNEHTQILSDFISAQSRFPIQAILRHMLTCFEVYDDVIVWKWAESNN